MNTITWVNPPVGSDRSYRLEDHYDVVFNDEYLPVGGAGTQEYAFEVATEWLEGHLAYFERSQIPHTCLEDGCKTTVFKVSSTEVTP